MEDDKPEIKPRMINLATPMLAVIFSSFFFFWYFGKSKDGTISSIIAATDPHKAMLVALFVSMIITGPVYCLQKHPCKNNDRRPVAGMTNMASNAVDAHQVKYLKYANPYNFTVLVLAAILFLIFGFIGSQSLK